MEDDLKFEVEKVSISAKSRKLKATWTVELENDFGAFFGAEVYINGKRQFRSSLPCAGEVGIPLDNICGKCGRDFKEMSPECQQMLEAYEALE